MLPYVCHSFFACFWAYKYNRRGEVGSLRVSPQLYPSQLLRSALKLSISNFNHGARMIKFIIF